MLFDNDDYLSMLFNNDKYNYAVNNFKDTNEKFYRGNMFDNEFVPYKNMTFIKPKLKTKREKVLEKLMEVTFAIIDYNLYLDVNPEDKDILDLYNSKCKELETLKEEYEKVYGPLCMMKGGYDTYKWINSPWPWDKEDSKYV